MYDRIPIGIPVGRLEECMDSSLAQRKSAGPITQRSEDRNLELLHFSYTIILQLGAVVAR